MFREVISYTAQLPGGQFKVGKRAFFNYKEDSILDFTIIGNSHTRSLVEDHPYNCLNGYSGSVTCLPGGYLRHTIASVKDTQKSKIGIFLTLGNDLRKNDALNKKEMEVMIKTAKKRFQYIFVCSPIIDNKTKPNVAKKFNNELEKVCEEKEVNFICTTTVTQGSEYKDDVHLTKTSYRRLFNTLLPRLFQLVEDADRDIVTRNVLSRECPVAVETFGIYKNFQNLENGSPNKCKLEMNATTGYNLHQQGRLKRFIGDTANRTLSSPQRSPEHTWITARENYKPVEKAHLMHLLYLSEDKSEMESDCQIITARARATDKKTVKKRRPFIFSSEIRSDVCLGGGEKEWVISKGLACTKELESVNVVKGETVNVVKGETVNVVKGETVNVVKRETVNVVKGETVNVVKGETVNVVKGETVNVVECENVRNDLQWFDQKMTKPNTIETPSLNLIEQFKTLAYTRNINHVHTLRYGSLDVQDLRTIPCKNWLSDMVITYFFNIYNQRPDSYSFFLNNINNKKYKNLALEIKQHFKNDFKHKILIIGMHVGTVHDLSFLGPKYIHNGKAYEANHFSFSIYDFHISTFIYCDSLGHVRPFDFDTKLEEMLSLLGITNPKYAYMHLPSDRPGIHTCTDECSLYPLQTCGSICGIVTIVFSAIAVYDYATFKKYLPVLFNIKCIETPYFIYLKEISQWSDYLRMVTMHWLIEGSISLNKIKIVNNITVPLTLHMLSREDHIKSKETTVLPAKDIFSGSLGVSKLLKLNELPGNIKNQISKNPSVTLIKRINKYRLQCTLKSGKIKQKRFPSINSNAIYNTINTFLSNETECLNWLEVNDLKWTFMKSLNTGIDTKRYIDSLKFDTRIRHEHNKKIVDRIYDADTPQVSLNTNPIWGQTHRSDETYKISEHVNPDIVTVLTNFYITCCGKTPDCKAICGNLFSDIDRSPSVIMCNMCKTFLASHSCINCKSINSMQWYKQSDTGEDICSACSQYYHVHKKQRPEQLFFIKPNKETTKYDPHFQCNFSLKFVLTKDQNKWDVYQFTESHHNTEITQNNRRGLSLGFKDKVDGARSAYKTTPQQILAGNLTKVPSFTGLDSTIDFRQSDPIKAMKKIRSRVKTSDKHMLDIHIGDGKADDIKITSDWRNTEKILENNIDSVLFFQRGYSKSNRDYHIIISNEQNLKDLYKFGKHVMGLDVDHNFNSARFKTYMYTFCDNKNIGRTAAFAICNNETTVSHRIHLQVILANIPCGEDCHHDKQLHIFNDYEGWFYTRPCARFNNTFSPILSHDKADQIRNTAISQNLHSTLCNFHALNAFQEKIMSDQLLALFLLPIETGFKCVMRSWCESMRVGMASLFINFIRVSLPDSIIHTETKENLIRYLKNNWFESNIWKSTFTSEVLFSTPIEYRRNCLLLTDNITERKFRTIEESDLNCHLNKKISTFVIAVINRILYRESEYTSTSSDTFKPSILHRSKEIKLATVGLNLVPKVEAIGDREDGWYLVECSTSLEDDADISDDFFVVNRQNDASLIDHDYYQPQTLILEQLRNQSAKLNSKTEDTNKLCKQLIKSLTDLICSHYRSETITFLPQNLLNLLQDKKYICNIKLCTCTCLYFIIRGQPYFCKHLYACLSIHHNETDLDKLLELYLNTVPIIPGYLQHFVINIEPTPPVLDLIDSLKDMAHPATSGDYQETKKGRLLKILHDSKISCLNYSGPLAKKQPHNMGNRRKEGPIKPDRYSLIEPVQKTTDPYCPQVKFPEMSTERHGGRKRIKPRARGINFKNVVEEAYFKLGKRVIDLDKNENENNNGDFDLSMAIGIVENSIKDATSCNTSKPKIEPDMPKILKKNKTDNIIMCGICFDNSVKPVYKCSSFLHLQSHIKSVHEPILCFICYKESGACLRFHSQRTFDHHVSTSHKNKCNNISNETLDMLNITKNIDSHLDVNKENKPVYCSKTINRLSHDITEQLKNLDELDSCINKKGNPGLTNLALNKANTLKPKDDLKTLKNTIFKSFENNDQENYFCSICRKIANSEPPTIECEKCLKWYHFKCVKIKRFFSGEWICSTCKALI